MGSKGRNREFSDDESFRALHAKDAISIAFINVANECSYFYKTECDTKCELIHA